MARQLELLDLTGLELAEISSQERARKSFSGLPYHVGDLRPITLKEWKDHPLDPQFRRRVQYEFERMMASQQFTLEDILPEKELDLITRYFFPVQGRMLRNQRELVGTQKSPQHLRWYLSWAMGRIFRRFSIGERALEILKPDLFVYKKIVRHSDPALWTIDDMYSASPEVLGVLGAHDPEIFEKFVLSSMRQFFPEWNPQVRYLSHKQK